MIAKMRIVFFFFFIFLTAHLSGGFSAVPKLTEDQLEHWENYTWQDKLKRASLNIVTFPVEIAHSIQTTSNEKSMAYGWSLGLLQGFGRGFLRLWYGTIELFTFPFDFPDEDKAPMITPEFVWEREGVKFT